MNSKKIISRIMSLVFTVFVIMSLCISTTTMTKAQGLPDWKEVTSFELGTQVQEKQFRISSGQWRIVWITTPDNQEEIANLAMYGRILNGRISLISKNYQVKNKPNVYVLNMDDGNGSYTLNFQASSPCTIIIEEILTDEEKAEIVKGKIIALPPIEELTIEDKDAVVSVRAAYESLTSNQKALVDEELVNKLRASEARIQLLEDQAAAAEVASKIESLPSIEELTIEDKDAVASVRAAYESLTSNQKALVDEELVNKLNAAEEKIQLLEEQVLVGWILDNGNWYYYDENGKMATGWLKENDKWYYLTSEGVMQTGWQKINGKWYYFRPSGAMTTGWVLWEDKWYYLSSSGAMLTGWQKIGGKRYYFESSGAMKTGWLKSGGKWYYLGSSGAMQTGWQKIGGKWYYFYSSGSMAANTTIGGYRLGTDGAWIQ